jgi:glucosamine--fructose-6-phosphate aminotransferase (isomerizing)
MCSVVGYVGKNYSRSFVLEGLRRLEYRGYDSAGFACLDSSDRRLFYAKSEGRLENLVNELDKAPIDGFLSIGHTRWATHGASSHENAHPQFDSKKKIAIVHNGIIENHRTLRAQLTQAGHVFSSDTDTEIIARLIEESTLTLDNSHTLKQIFVHVLNKLEGAFAFVCLMQDYPDHIIMARKSSPLCIGIGEDEMFIASDMLAFAGKTNKVVFLPDESFALVRKDALELYTFSGVELPVTIQEIEFHWDDNGKNGHEHFMLKEIYEQKGALYDTIQAVRILGDGLWDQIGFSKDYIRTLDSVVLIGCGASWHAARIAQFYFEHVCMIPVQVHLASEFRYKSFFPALKTLYVFISQSGETADTLEALRLVKSVGLPTIALTNAPASAMVREAHGFLLTHAGREIAVASTKAFSTQLAVLYWFAYRIALAKEIVQAMHIEQAEEDLLRAAHVLEDSLEKYKFEIEHTLAKRYAQYNKAIFLGRHMSYPFAMEAALKFKELAYIFSQCYPAGELKHGPLALVDSQIPIFVFSYQDPLIYQKLLSNVQEAKARGGHIVAFAFEGQHELYELADCTFVISPVNPLLGPLAMTGLMQFFAYAVANELGLPIDKPRNLAKSVTVE